MRKSTIYVVYIPLKSKGELKKIVIFFREYNI
jgi:hypothetical protein